MSLDEIRAETIRMRGFIRAAETQATKILGLIDTDAGAAPPPAPEPEPEPTPDPIPDPTPPPPTGGLFANQPADLPVRFDHRWDYDWQMSSGRVPSGWDAGALDRSDARVIIDPTCPTGERVLEIVYPSGMSGNGVLALVKSFGSAFDRFYVAWAEKFDADFDHNTNSEKLMFFNPGQGQFFLEYHWRAEAIEKIRDASGADYIEANLMPKRSRDGVHDAPWVNGVWLLRELYFERSTGTVKWWTNGEPRAHHTGRSFGAVSTIKLDTTWGGGGDKQGVQSRYVGRIIAAGA